MGISLLETKLFLSVDIVTILIKLKLLTTRLFHYITQKVF